MKVFVKPSGVEVEVCESSYDTAINIGWKPKESIQKEVKQEVKQENKPTQKRKG